MFKHETQVIKFLLQWYSVNARNLPWRKKNTLNLPDPYFVFVSEYMLQQTTVNTVKNKFNDFILKWPSLNKLAQTSEPNILKFWSGLGYYSRARNLLKSAKIIHKNFKNNIPKTYDELIQLPGIGDYTAKAILGIGLINQLCHLMLILREFWLGYMLSINQLIKSKINLKI